VDSPQTWNRFSYTKNNPIKFVDPSGHIACDDTDENGKCINYEQNQKRLENSLKRYKEVNKVKEEDMKEVRMLGQSTFITPGEYELLLNSDGEINNWRLFQMGSLARHALNTTAQLFPGESLHNSRADAFRHAYWNALMTQTFGADYAQAFTTAHESSPDSIREEQFMDLHNNAVGRAIGSANPYMRPEMLQKLVMNALTNGDLYVWDGQNIYFSDDCPTCVGQPGY